MKITKLDFDGLLLIEPDIYYDERGYFYESYNSSLLNKFIGEVNFVQDNQSLSKMKVIRGLHYQLPPFAQSKLVKVIKGVVLDIVVDLRSKSKTFGESLIIELSELNQHQLFIPKGFAHGFISCSDETIFFYKVDEYYNKSCERGINILDEQWKVKIDLDSSFSLSKKDRTLPHFNENEKYFD